MRAFTTGNLQGESRPINRVAGDFTPDYLRTGTLLFGVTPLFKGPSDAMSFWRKLFGDKTEALRPQRLDYLNEALALERQNDFEAALTSYRLALRDNPNDARILQSMAIAFTKTGQSEEAIRYYRRALQLDGSLSGAHYGLAFRLKAKGEHPEAAQHLKAFLAKPPRGPDAERWVNHAEAALREIETETAPEPS